MSPVRVAVDVGPLAGRRTGIGVAVAAVVEQLGERDDVALHPYRISFRAAAEAGVSRLPMPAALAHRCWMHTDRPRADRWLGDAQVVHGTNYVVPPSRLPRVVSVYDCWFLDHPDEAIGDVRRSGRVLRRSIEAGATVHACSGATAIAVSRHFPDARVVHIPLAALSIGMPPAVGPIPELRGRTFVLALATLERRKNLTTLVQAFGLLAEADPEVSLVLAGGDGDDRGAVDAAILALSPTAAARVLITGWVPEDARSWLLHHARVLAYPSIDEGFGFPLLDAMQSGLPIVASDAGSIPEVAGDASLRSDPLDAAALATNLALAIDDEGVRRRLLEAAPARLAAFSWERCAADLAALYHRLATGD